MAQPDKSNVFFIIADDDLDDHAFVEDTSKLSTYNYKIHSVFDGTQLIRLLSEKYNDPNSLAFRPDFILLDINMPRLDGIGALKEMRKNKNFDGIPVFILSTARNEIIVSEFKALGAMGFYTKPSRQAELLAIIDGACNIALSAKY